MNCQPLSAQSQQSVFKASLPYAVGTLSVAGVGIAVALTAGSIASGGVIAAIVLGTLGCYAFCGVVTAALSSNDVYHFRKRVWKYMTTFTIISGIVGFCFGVV